MPVDARPFQSQVHHTANRTLDRTTADRQLQRRHARVVHPTFATVPFEVVALALQCLAGTRTTHAIDRGSPLLEPSLEEAAPLATDPRLTLPRRPAPLQGRDPAQVLHRVIEVHQLVHLLRFDAQPP